MASSSLRAIVGLVLFLWGVPQVASAIPLLQLDIAGGWYDEDDETVMASSNTTFTLYAYLTPQPGTSAAELSALLSDTYYVAASMKPNVTVHPAYDSFTFNGTTVDGPADMVYGVPPDEGFLGGYGAEDSGDLARHGTYETYFKQFSFQFSASDRTVEYNVQDDAGQGPTPSPTGGMYYKAFQVDQSMLHYKTAVHFDLYTLKTLANGDIDIDKFAPFSHDASGLNGPVPEPGSLLLLASGAAAVAAAQRRRFRTRP